MNDFYTWTALTAGVVGCYFATNHQALHLFSSSRLEHWFKEMDRPHRMAALMEHRAGLMWLTALLRSVFTLVVILAMVSRFRPETATDQAFWWAMGKAFVAASVIILVFVVAIASSLGRYAAEPILAYNYPVLYVLYVVLRPGLSIFRGFDWLIRRLLGWTPPADDDANPLQQEILDAVSEGEKSGLVDEAQKERIEAVIEFPSISVGEIMTPRTDMEGLEDTMDLAAVKAFMIEKGFSRYPVYKDDLDHLLGMLYVKDLLPFVGEDAAQVDWLGNLRQALMVPETKPVVELLEEFRSNKVHVAIVLDEYGGTAGLVTIEDILEEIVGDIHDEHEKVAEQPGIHQVQENVFEIDARVYIDDVNDDTELELPDDDDYETIGGFVFSTLGHVPQTGEMFEYQNMRITVLDAERTKVNRVRLEMLSDTVEGNGNGQ